MNNKRPGGEMKPADSQEPTKSQLLPLAQKWQELPRKPYFIPGVIVVLAVLLLFHYMGDRSSVITVKYAGVLPVQVPLYTVVLAVLITCGTAFGIYRMVGKPTTWWVMPAVAAVTGFLASSPIMTSLQALTRMGTGDMGSNEPFLSGFVNMFFRAGLPEELLKAIPVAIGVWIAIKVTNRQSPASALRVAEPLDGILIGAAAGLGFAFAETIFLYVPRTILGGDKNAVAIFKAFVVLVDKIGYEHAVVEIQKVMPGRGISLELMIPRLLGNICGHAAYAGLFGYYIGLASMKSSNRLKTVLTGLAIAAGAHAAWNAAGGDLPGLLVAILAFALLTAAIVKAREISPDRSQLVASQIIDRFSRVHAGAAPAPVMAASAASAAFPQPAVKPAAAPVSMTWDDPSNLLVIEIGTARIPASLGARVYERQAPGTSSSRSDGIVAEVNANPNEPSVLGIKNLSSQTWFVTTDNGDRRELAPGRSIRMARGMQIALGDLVAQVK